jgi:hypothetical protein
MHFYLTVKITFILKTEPNRIAITAKINHKRKEKRNAGYMINMYFLRTIYILLWPREHGVVK